MLGLWNYVTPKDRGAKRWRMSIRAQQNFAASRDVAERCRRAATSWIPGEQRGVGRCTGRTECCTPARRVVFLGVLEHRGPRGTGRWYGDWTPQINVARPIRRGNRRIARERDWRCCRVVKPRALPRRREKMIKLGTPARSILPNRFFGRSRADFEHLRHEGERQCGRKDPERCSEKVAQNASAITTPVFVGPQTTFALIYREITTDLEEHGSFGFFDGRK